jgi:hypothetical protein
VIAAEERQFQRTLAAGVVHSAPRTCRPIHPSCPARSPSGCMTRTDSPST